jgi:hypothetical protein
MCIKLEAYISGPELDLFLTSPQLGHLTKCLVRPTRRHYLQNLLFMNFEIFSLIQKATFFIRHSYCFSSILTRNSVVGIVVRLGLDYQGIVG